MSSPDSKRGDIRFPRAAKRARTFAGLRFGKITPTDIDCSTDFGGELFIFVEGKELNAPFEDGQRLHLELLVKGLRKGGKRAFAVLVNYPYGNEVIDYSGCSVAKYFWGDAWLVVAAGYSLRAFFEWALAL